MKNNYDRILWGIVFIAVGVLFALNIAGVIEFNIWSYVWPIFLAIIGVSMLLGDKKNVGGWFFIVLSTLFFLRRILGDAFDSRYLFVTIIILIGIFIIVSSFKKDEIRNISGKQNQFVVFGGRNDRIVNGEYYGTNTLCVFGGHEIDLRQFNFTHDVEIVATAVFGGVTVFLPQNVNVSLKSLPIFGGTENKTLNTDNNPYTVYIKVTAVFGGVEVRN